MEFILRNILNAFTKFVVKVTTKKNNSEGGVLVIKLEVLGDFIMFLPSLKYYREYFKGQKITLLVDSPLNKKIAEKYLTEGLIDSVLLLDSRSFIKNPLSRIIFGKKLYRLNFKTAIYSNYYRRFLGDFLIDITGAEEKIGFNGFGFEKYSDKRMLDVYTKTVSIPHEIKTEFERYKHFVETITNKKIDYSPEFLFDKTKDSPIQKPYVVIFPGAGLAYRKWPADRFAKICEYLIDKGLTPVLSGSPQDRQDTEKVFGLISEKYKGLVVDQTMSVNIFETANLLHHALFYFGNETGVPHLAMAVGCPTLVILGGGVMDIFYPYGNLDKHRSIYWKHMTCKNDEWRCATNLPPNTPAPCIEAVTVNQAITEIDGFVNELKHESNNNHITI